MRRRTVRTVVCVSFVAVFCLLWATAGWAQLASTASINGTVTDATKALVAGAKVVAINEATGVQNDTQSNADGTYIFTGLGVASYTISVTKEGFETSKVTGITLHPSVVTTINVILTVGQVVSQVTVSATLAQVQTTTSEVSNQVAAQSVSTLPLNGRNYQSLSALMPGVTNLSPGVAEGQGGFLTSNTMSVNGMGTGGTLYTVDGMWDMNTGNMTQTTITPNPDTIQEVRVLQNNFSVQYGLLQSSVVLLATKSGTDQFHGSAFEYLRNTDLNARNFFGGATVPQLNQNIFGYTIGGPFYIPNHINSAKKRTFFFWSEQWTDQHIGNIVRGADPTAAMRQGDFSALCTSGFTAGICNTPSQQLVNPFNGNAPYMNNDIVTATSPLNTNSAALLNAVAPLPNNAPAGFLNYLNVNPTINTTRDDEAKVDHNFSTRLRLMAEYLDDRQLSATPSETFGITVPYTTYNQSYTTNNQLAQIVLTATLTPNMVNTTSIGMNNYVVSLAVAGATIDRDQLTSFSETLPYSGFRSNRLPHITFGQSYSSIGTSYELPLDHASDLEDTLSDDWSWLHGKHYIQAGGNLVLGTKRQDNYTQTNGQWSFSGNFTGNAIADYLIGQSTTFIQTSAYPRPYDHYHIFSPYIQDRIKLTRRLTATVGFRWEFVPRPHAQVGYDSIFVTGNYNAANAPIVQPNGNITTTPTYDPLNGIVRNGINGVPLNFYSNHEYFAAPSVGFAWDVFGDGKTSLRGGYGITYQRTFTSGDCSYTCSGNPPLVSNVTLNNALFPNPVGTGTAKAAAIETIAGSVDPDFRPAEIQSYSLSLEHQFKGDFFASIAAAGTIQRDLIQGVNINQALPDAPYNFNPNINFNSTLNAAYVQNYYSPYLGYGNITANKAEGNGFWNALEVNVRHPAGRNIMVTVAYTWQRGLASTTIQNGYNPGAYYGPTSNFVPQILNFSWIWTVPYFRSAKGIEGAALGGWKYSNVTTIQSGFMNNLGMSAARAGLANRPDVNPGNSTFGPKTVGKWFNTGAYFQPPAGYFGDAGTYSVHGPGTVNFDMALYKDFRIKERHTFEFRAELFNIFNHTNFAALSTSYGASNFGAVTSARDPRIAEFALRYQF